MVVFPILFLSIFVGLLSVPPCFAQDSTALTDDEVLLPKMIVEGDIIRPGTVGVVPDLGGVNDAATLLSRVPGANVNSNGPLSGIAQYRGLFGDRMNVISDGANYKPACANSMDTPLSHVPTSLTESLKIYRGIAPVSSGIETLGGSIVQETRRGDFAFGDELEFHGKANSGYNSVNDGRYVSIFGNVATLNHKFRIGGSHEKGDDYEWTDGINRPTEHDRNAATVGYGIRIDDHILDFGYNYNDTKQTGTPSLPMDITYSRGGVPTFNYEGKIADKYEIKAGFQYQDIQHRMDNFTFRGQGAKVRQSDNTARGFGYKLSLAGPLLDGKLMIGADGDNIEHDAIITDPTKLQFRVDNFNDANRDRYGLFTEWKGNLVEDLELELGARINFVRMTAGNVSASTSTFDPATGSSLNAPAKLQTTFNNSTRRHEDDNVDAVAVFNYSVSQSLGIELGFARKNRSPSYQERYVWLPLSATGGLADGRNYIGTVDLRPETSYQVELGFNWQNDDFYFAPRFFYRYVEDYIQGVPTTNAAALKVDPNTLQFSNIDAYLYGVDAEVGFRFWEDFRINGIISYVRGRRNDISDNLYRIAPLNGRIEFYYDTLEWLAGAELIGYAEQDKVSNFNDEIATGGYAYVNLRGQYRPQYRYLQGLQLGFGIENLLDKGYRVHLSGLNRSPVNEGTAIGEHLPGPGRNFYVTLSYDW